MDNANKSFDAAFPKLQEDSGTAIITSTPGGTHSLSFYDPATRRDTTDGKEHDVNCIAAKSVN